MEIAERLKTARAALGLKQDEMASQSGVSYSVFQKYEMGRSVPGGEAIAGFVRLGISANWLLTGEGPMLLKDVVERPRSVLKAEIAAIEEEQRDTKRLAELRVARAFGYGAVAGISPRVRVAPATAPAVIDQPIPRELMILALEIAEDHLGRAASVAARHDLAEALARAAIKVTPNIANHWALERLTKGELMPLLRFMSSVADLDNPEDQDDDAEGGAPRG